MSRWHLGADVHSLWNVPQVFRDEPDIPSEPQSARAKEKPRRMPVRIGHGNAGGFSGHSQNLNRRTVGGALGSYRVSPGSGPRRMPQKVVKTPQGVKLVKNKSEDKAAGGGALGHTSGKTNLKSHGKPQELFPAERGTRKRALKQLDFNRLEGGPRVPAAPIPKIVISSCENMSGGSTCAWINEPVARSDLRRFALAQSSENKKRLLEVSVKATPTPPPTAKLPREGFGRINAPIPQSPLLLMSTRKDPVKRLQANSRRTMLPVASMTSTTLCLADSDKKRSAVKPLLNMEERIEESKLKDISSYVAYQAQFVRNKRTPVRSDESAATIGLDRLPKCEDFAVEEVAAQSTSTCSNFQQVSLNNAVLSPSGQDILHPFAVGDKVQPSLHADKLMTLIAELYIIEAEQAKLCRQKLDIDKKLVHLQDRRVLTIQKCASFCKSSEAIGRADGATIQDGLPARSNVVEATVKSVPEQPATPGRRRSARLARLSGFAEIGTQDLDSLTSLCPLSNKTDESALLIEPTVKHCDTPPCNLEVMNSTLEEVNTHETLKMNGFNDTMSLPETCAPPCNLEVMNSTLEEVNAQETLKMDGCNVIMSSSKMSAKPRRSIVNYRKLQTSFPGLMKTPSKTPVNKSTKKRIPVELDTPADISRRVQASLELLHDN